MPEEVVVDQETLKIALSGDLRFISPEIASSVLGDILGNRYQTEWLAWAPETLRPTIQSDFHTEIHPVNWGKILAVQFLLLVDDFWSSWDNFAIVTKTFNNLIPDFKLAEECSPGEMAWAVEEANKIRQEPFGDEVVLYVRAMCQNQGLILFPEQLSFAHVVTSDAEKNLQLAWESASKQLTFAVEEDAVGVQLARLNSIRHMIRALQGESERVMLKYERKW